MPCKYQHLRGKVAAFKLEEAYQGKVNAAKKELLGADYFEGVNVAKLAAAFATADREKKRLEALISVLNVELEALSQLLIDNLESESQQKVELASGAFVYLQDSPYPVVSDKAKLFEWIKKEKLVNLLTAHHKMLCGMCSERLIAGKPIMPGVSVFLKTRARVRFKGEKDE